MAASQEQLERMLEGGASPQQARAAINTGQPQVDTVTQPRAEGLTPAQYQQVQLNRAPKEPIPIWDEQNPDPGPRQDGQGGDGEPLAERPTHKIRNDSTGEVYAIQGPPGSTPEQAYQLFFSLSPEQQSQLKLDGEASQSHAWDRFRLAMEESDNVAENLSAYGNSHFPHLYTTITFDDEGNIAVEYPQEMYGEDFYTLTPEERRRRVEQVKAGERGGRFSEAIEERKGMKERGEWDLAGGMGVATNFIADPIALVPVAGAGAKIAQAGTGAAKLGRSAEAGFFIGGGYGGAYGASEVLADEGFPTTPEKAVEAGKRVGGEAAKGAAAGAVLGPVLTGIGMGVSRAIRAPKGAALKSETHARKLGRNYYEYMWNQQALGDTAIDAATAAKKAFGLTVDDVYQIRTALGEPDRWSSALGGDDALARLAANRFIQLSDPATAVGTGGINKAIRPIASVMREIAPKVYRAMIGMEGQVLRKTHNYHAETIPFIKAYRKLKRTNRQDAKRFGLALYNKDFTTARNILAISQGREGVATLDKTIDSLSRLGKEMKKNGIEFDGIDHYFPRLIKDIEGLKLHLRSKKQRTGFARTKAAAAKRLKRPLTENEEIKLLNRYMSTSFSSTKKLTGSTRKRRVVKVDEDMVKFYDDPITSLDLHIRDAVSAIERSKFFGENMKRTKDGLELVDNSIGALVKKMGIGEDVTNQVTSLLRSRFTKGEQSGHGAWATLRQGIGGLTLGNPYSAVRQLGDIPVSLWYNGLINGLKSIPKATLTTMKSQMGIETKGGINADAFGYMVEMAQELSTGGVGSNFVKRAAANLYVYGGFKAVDRLGKNILLESSLRKAQNMAKSRAGKRKFVDRYGTSYTADDMQRLLKDLDDGTLSEIVKQHIGAELMRVQPVSRSNMPQMYLDHPNGRIFWQFRTWGLNQIELARTTAFKDMFSKDPRKVAKGASSFALLYAYVGATGMGITELQRWAIGKDPLTEKPADFFTDEMFWQVMGNFTMDRYGLEQLAEKTDAADIIAGFTPPSITIPASIAVHLAASASAGVTGDMEGAKTQGWKVARETGIGRIIYNQFGGGAEESNEKLKKERLKAHGL